MNFRKTSGHPSKNESVLLQTSAELLQSKAPLLCDGRRLADLCRGGRSCESLWAMQQVGKPCLGGSPRAAVAALQQHNLLLQDQPPPLTSASTDRSETPGSRPGPASSCLWAAAAGATGAAVPGKPGPAACK